MNKQILYLTHRPGVVQVFGGPLFLLYGPAHRKLPSPGSPPPDLPSLEFQRLLSLLHSGIEKITDFSPSLTLDVTLSRQPPLWSGPQFPHPLNGLVVPVSRVTVSGYLADVVPLEGVVGQLAGKGLE